MKSRVSRVWEEEHEAWRWPWYECAAEFIGTAFFVFLATSISAVLVAHYIGDDYQDLVRALYTGSALTVVYSIFGRVSGGHFNPNVTVGFTMIGKFHAGLGLLYLSSQMLGGFCGGFLAYVVNSDPIENRFEKEDFESSKELAAIFGPVQDYRFFWFQPFLSATLSAYVLLAIMNAINDFKNENVPFEFMPILYGVFAYTGVHLAFSNSWLGGPFLNPAKDATGLTISYYAYDYFDIQVYHAVNNILGNLLGAVLGSHAYMFFVEYQWFYGRNDYFYNRYAGKVRVRYEKTNERGSHVLSPGIPRYETEFGPEQLTDFRKAHLYEPNIFG